MKIIWDEPKRLANLDKHGMDFADLNERFFDTALVRKGKINRYQAISSDRRQHSRRDCGGLRGLWRGSRLHHQHAGRQQARKGPL
ncbi:hypothetical protein [Bradyrhizobium sp. USDA 4452]